MHFTTAKRDCQVRFGKKHAKNSMVVKRASWGLSDNKRFITAVCGGRLIADREQRARAKWITGFLEIIQVAGGDHQSKLFRRERGIEHLKHSEELLIVLRRQSCFPRRQRLPRR